MSIDLSRIPLWCVQRIEPERGWGGHFYSCSSCIFAFLFTIWPYCSLECEKGLMCAVHVNKLFYYMAELIQGEKEHSDWFTEQSEFSFTDR